jgi:hypothetical protein
MQNTDAKDVRADAMLRRHLPSKCHDVCMMCTAQGNLWTRSPMKLHIWYIYLICVADEDRFAPGVVK